MSKNNYPSHRPHKKATALTLVLCKMCFLCLSTVSCFGIWTRADSSSSTSRNCAM